MPESKLPRGPWQVVRAAEDEGSVPLSVVDADGAEVLSPVLAPYSPGECLAATPEVLRAVEALPVLVEEARRLMSWVKVERRSGLELPYSVDMCVAALGDALALVDAD
jgi:hypothetical protein